MGLVVPMLPATPFLLLSAGCFARSSEKWHRWLLANAVFGPLIANWEAHRCIGGRTKVVALVSMAVIGGASVVFAMEAAWMRLVTLLLLLAGAGVVLSIRTCAPATGSRRCPPEEGAPEEAPPGTRSRRGGDPTIARP